MDYNNIISQLRKIQSNILDLNEDANAPDQNGGRDNIDADLDALLKDNGANGNQGQDQNQNGENDQQNQQPADDGGDENQPADDNMDDLENAADQNADQNNDGGNNFETDNEGLMDTITKLTKSGHTVKIVVSAEGKQMFSVDGKQASLKQLNELLLKKPARNGVKNNKNMQTMMEQINDLKRQVKLLKSSQSINENNETIQIKKNDYNALIEMIQDLNFKVDEQDALIKNYEVLKDFGSLDESNDEEINQILDELSDAVNELDDNNRQYQLRNISGISYNIGADTSLGVMSESVMPILNEMNLYKNYSLFMLDEYDNHSDYGYLFNNINENNNHNQNVIYRALSDIQDLVEVNNNTLGAIANINANIGNTMKFINMLEFVDKCNNYMSKVNLIDRYNTLLESKLSTTKPINRKEFSMILAESGSDIIIVPSDNSINGTPNNFPTYEDFNKTVTRTINDAYNSINKSSAISVRDGGDDTLFPKSSTKKAELPIIMSQVKENVTIKSAITNLAESLVDIDGNVDLNLCEQAYLYKRVSKPQSMADFAMPIAIMEQSEHKLYAHPELIKNVAKILKNESCMKTYDIKTKEELYALRESLTPYLEKIGAEIPWA